MALEAVDFDGKKEFAEAFNFSQNYLASRAVMQQMYWLLNSSEFKSCNSKVHKFAEYYVNKALELSHEELEKQQGYVFCMNWQNKLETPKC